MTNPSPPVPLLKKVIFWAEISFYLFVSVVIIIPLVLIPFFWGLLVTPEKLVKKKIYYRPFDYWMRTFPKWASPEDGIITHWAYAVSPTSTGDSPLDETYRSFVSLDELVGSGNIKQPSLNVFIWGLRYVGFGDYLSAIYSLGKGVSSAGSTPVFTFYKVSSPLCCLTFLGGKMEFDYTHFYIEVEESKRLIGRLKQVNPFELRVQQELKSLKQGQINNEASLEEVREVTSRIAKNSQLLPNMQKAVCENTITAGETKELLAHLIDGKSNRDSRLAVERAHLTNQARIIIDNIVRIESSPRSDSQAKKEALLFSDDLRCIIFSLAGCSSDEIVEKLEQTAPETAKFRKNTDPSRITRMKRNAILSLRKLGLVGVEMVLSTSIDLSNRDITRKRGNFLEHYSADLSEGVDKKDYLSTLGGK